MDKRRDEYSVKEKEDEIPQRSDASRKIFEFLTHRLPVITGEFFIGPHRPLLRTSAPRWKGGTFRMPREPRRGTPRTASGPLLSRPRYRSRRYLISVGPGNDKKQRASPHRAPLRNSHYYSPWNSRRRRGDAMGRGSRCTGATDRFSPPFPRQGFLVFHGFLFFYIFSFFAFPSFSPLQLLLGFIPVGLCMLCTCARRHK